MYKILVVDDEPDLEPLVLMRMRKEIRSGLYDFQFARNGVEALQVLKDKGDFDMVLSDINMPQMDGLTLLEQISGAEEDLRSVIISAYGDMQNIRTAMNRGAFDFIIKPIDFDDFRTTITRGLSQLAKWREALSSRDRLVSLQHELDVANTIQQSVLPTSFPKTDKFQIEGAMDPAREVGGDFFYVESLEDDRIAIAIADVSDKGVPAALFMMLTRTLLKSTLREKSDPGKVMKIVNDLLWEDNETSMFVTLCYAVYNPDSGELVYANGGHNPPLFVRRGGDSDLLPLSGGIALGVAPKLDYAEGGVKLAPGDNVVFYTDGVTEAVNSNNEEFGVARLREVFRGAAKLDAGGANKAVFKALRSFTSGTPQFDDITCLTLHRKGGK